MTDTESQRNAERRTAIVLLLIGAAEAAPLALSLSHISADRMLRLYDPLEAGPWANVLSAALAAAFVAYTIWALPEVRRRILELSWLKALAVPFAFITGSMEELWFRQALMNGVAASGGGLAMQVVVSALLFGLVHAIWGVIARRWRAALGAMVATSVLGAALAVVYLMGGRHVAPCIWAHTLINLAIEPWLLLAAATGMNSRILARKPH